MEFELVTDPYAASPHHLEPYQEEKIPGVMVRGDWSPELSRFYTEHRIEALYLNVSHGWAGDYAFLSDLPWLRCLDMIALPCNDLSVIGSLTSLQQLSIECATRKAVDFSGLTSLEQCYLSFWNGARSIFECTSLRKLYIHKFPGKWGPDLANLKALQDLTLYSQSLTSLEPLANLKHLEKLTVLGARKLESLDGLEQLTSLRSLQLDQCSLLSDLSPLSKLQNLEHLVISDWKSIDSIEPIQHLEKLRAFAFSGSRTQLVDGDLSPLEKLPQLSMLNFVSRRHYSHKLIKKWNWDNFLQPDVLLERK